MFYKNYIYYVLLGGLLVSVSCKDSAPTSETKESPSVDDREGRKRFIEKAGESSRSESLDSTEADHVGKEKLKASVVSEWDPSRCMAGLTKVLEDKEGPEASAALRLIFQQLGEVDPDIGLSALDQLSVGQLREAAVGALFNGISRTNETQLFEVLQRLPTEDDQRRALSIIASRLSGKPVESLLQIKATIPEGQSKYSGIINNAIGVSLSEQEVPFGRIEEFDLPLSDKSLIEKGWLGAQMSRNIEKLILDIDNGLIPKDFVDENIASVALHYAIEKPKSAVSWVRKLPDSTQRYRAIELTVGRWLSSNSEEAGMWVSDLPEGKDREHATIGLVEYLVRSKDLELAKAWADSLDSPEAKTRVNLLLGNYKK